MTLDDSHNLVGQHEFERAQEMTESMESQPLGGSLGNQPKDEELDKVDRDLLFAALDLVNNAVASGLDITIRCKRTGREIRIGKHHKKRE